VDYKPTQLICSCPSCNTSEIVIQEPRTKSYRHFGTHWVLLKVDGMQTTDQPHDDTERPIQDVFGVSSKPTLSFATVHDHGLTTTTRRKSPWFSTWSTFIFISIIFGIIFVFPRSPSLPSWSNSFLMPCLSDTTRDGMTFSKPTSPAFSSNGRTDQVQWDSYTLVLRGQRVLI
jgi:hypothetical protein